MKNRFLALFSLVFLLSISICGQERNFDLQVSLEENNIIKTDNNIFATVTITNNSRQVLITDGLGFLEFRFSKNMLGGEQGLERNDSISRIDIPVKKLRENESLNFRVNLAKQDWYKSEMDFGNISLTKKFVNISKENIFFTASVKVLTGYRNAANAKIVYKDGKPIREPVGKRPTYKTVNSNVITVILN